MTTLSERTEDLEIWFAACEEQDYENARLAAASFTGAAEDLSTGDVGAWCHGVRLGWRSTTAEAETLVREQLSRETHGVEAAERT